MILVTLGTQDKEFSRLLKEIDKQIEKGNIKEKVIVQAGCTKYKSKNMEIFDLIEPKELEKLVQKCNLLITHGGVGSILLGIRNHKKIIAASRLKKYKEHTNDHQKQIVKEFESRGYLLELRNFSQLDKVLEKSKTFKPTSFKSNNDRFVSIVKDYIEKDQHISWYNKYRDLSSFGYMGIFLNLVNIFIFNLLLSRMNIYFNIISSYFITFIINIFCLILMQVSIKKKYCKFILMKALFLLLDLGFIYTFTRFFGYDIMFLKFISNLLIMIISYIIIKFCFRKKEV